MAIFDLYLGSINAWIEADSVAGTFQRYTDYSTGELSEEVETLSPSDLQTVLLAAPPVPLSVDAREVLENALTVLRGATADRIVTPQEAAALEQVVIPALERFRDIGAFDPEASYTALLVLAQVIQAVYAVGKAQSAVIQQLSVAASAATARLDALEAAVFPSPEN